MSKTDHRAFERIDIWISGIDDKRRLVSAVAKSLSEAGRIAHGTFTLADDLHRCPQLMQATHSSSIPFSSPRMAHMGRPL